MITKKENSMSFSPNLGQAPKGYELFSTLLPQQFQVLSRLLGGGGLESSPLYQQGMSYLQNLLSGSPEATEAFEKPLMSQYQREIVPELAEKFTGSFGPGGHRSSGFQNALAASGKDLAERLGSLRAGLQMQALPQALGYAQAPYSLLQNLLGISGLGATQTPLSFGQQLAVAGLQGLGSGIGSYLGGKI